jgi:hypothetical protein
MTSHPIALPKIPRTIVIVLLLGITCPLVEAVRAVDASSINDSLRSRSLQDESTGQEERIYHQGDIHGARDEEDISREYPTPDRKDYETAEQVIADTAIDHSFDPVNERLQQYQPTEETVSDFYDQDELAQEIAKQSIVLTSTADTDRQDRTYASASSEPASSKYTAWIAHGSIAVLCFGVLLPASISSALFRDFLPEYWIYIHVFMNVATFLLLAITVGIAFTTMNSLGDKNEGHLKELHHIVGLGLLLLVSFQTANGFLRPPREFITEDVEDTTPGAIHTSDWERSKFTPRTLWHLVHRTAGIVIFTMGTWQVQSGMAIYAKKYNGADWGSVYLGYVGWLVFVIGGAKLWCIYKEKKRGGDKNDWNAEDELFDTDSHLYDVDD